MLLAAIILVIGAAALSGAQNADSMEHGYVSTGTRGDKHASVASANSPVDLKEGLNLSPHELKQFSSHAFRMLKSKCPGLDEIKMSLIQRYVIKALAPGMEWMTGFKRSGRDREKFRDLLESLMVCEKEKKVEPGQMYFSSGSHESNEQPIEAKLDLVLQSNPEPNPSPTSSTEKPMNNTEAVLKSMVKAWEVAHVKNHGKNETAPIHSTTHPTTTAAPKTTTQKPKHTSTERVKKWFRHAFEWVKSFFTRTLPDSFSRKRRSAEDVEIIHPIIPIRKPSKQRAPVSSPEKSIQTFVEELLSVFSSKCGSAKEQMASMQMAAHKLLDYVSKDANVVLALESLLDAKFLATVQKCRL